LKHDVNAIPQYAVLSMLLEATCKTKPGNVDRGHDFDDLTLHHFAASAVATLPSWRLACDPDAGLGEVIYLAVQETQRWQRGGNTYIGTILLNAPLARAFALGGAKWENELEGVLDSTTPNDAVRLYDAMGLAPVRTGRPRSGEPDVSDPAAAEELVSRGLNMRDVMCMAEGRDLVAAEWCRGFPVSRRAAADMRGRLNGDSSDAVVTRTYLEILSRQPDTLVTVEHGPAVADDVMQCANDMLAGRLDVNEFDADLRSRHVNPGTSADLTAAACFIMLFEEGPGWI